MKDVAKRAGVSQATVSYVLNDAAGQQIPPSTREKVFRAARELGYRPNSAARFMRTNRTNFVGFVTDEIATTPFAGAIIKGAQDAARAHGRILLLVNTDGDPEFEKQAIESMLEYRVEGIVFATMYHRSVCPPATLAEVPAVLLDCFSESRSIASVVPDEFRGGQTATEVLLNKGHRRIGFLNNIDPIPATGGRLQGYQAALAASGIAFDSNLVASAPSEARGGYAGTLALMERPDRPTALFCFNDRMAMGAYDALRKLGLTVPNDVAVIGFDNQDIIAAALHPGLSTMQLPHYEMGQWAINYLVEQPRDGEPPVQNVMECRYIERESV